VCAAGFHALNDCWIEGAHACVTSSSLVRHFFVGLKIGNMRTFAEMWRHHIESDLQSDFEGYHQNILLVQKRRREGYSGCGPV
jgi:hypothetical protein